MDYVIAGTQDAYMCRPICSQVVGVFSLHAGFAAGIVGLGFRESATGKTVYLAQYRVEGALNLNLSLIKRNSDTSGSSATDQHWQPHYGVMWQRIRYDTTNIYFDVSLDGVNFVNVFSEAKATHFTTEPDQVMFAFYLFHATGLSTVQGQIQLLGWRETT